MANFEKETGINVIYDVFDSNEVLEGKLMAGSTGFDLVVPSASFLERQLTAGVFQPLDKSKLPGWKNLDPELLKLVAKHDPDNKYAMPYMWATTGIGYNVDKVKAVLGDDAPVNSWDLVLKPENLEKLKSCGVSFLDAPEEIFATVLNYLGKDPNSSKADDYTGPATDLLLKLRPNIRYFHSSQYINDLANGDTCVAIGWAGDVWQAANRAKEAKNGVNISFSIPKEGAMAFFTNLLLVLFGRYTGAKGIFLTGNTGVSHSQAVLWLIVFWLGFGWVQSIVIAGVLTGVFWAFSTTLIVKPIAKVTNNAGFTIAHNQMLGLWFFSKFAHKFGDPEKHDAENLKLPGWLAIFNHNVTAIAIVMTLFVGGFLLATGIDNVQLMAKGKPWYIYIINLGLQFSMYMVILLQGVRMMVGEINGSFKGWQDRFIPNAIPAVDVAALLPFSPNAATLGFVFCTFGTIFSMGILLLIHSPIMVLPGFVPLFFSGGPIGVLANRMGGYRSVIICTFLLGIIQTFGTVWAIPLTGLAKEGVGWTGIFDWATLWPAICELLKFIASTFHLGPYSI
ncbi:hypothetical protein DNM50_12135 [Salmonella enterica subsp. enterica serovar Weltevreden]|nr:hypothetical protein [Salmonella enterica subsp. enterica serovar Weltevreden]